jgi:hypothetical protein
MSQRPFARICFYRQVQCWKVLINQYVDQPKKLAKHLEDQENAANKSFPNKQQLVLS